jgi:hypothetical protein
MSTQEDIVNRYGAAIAVSTSITDRDLGAVDLALRLAVQDAARLAQPVAEPWRDYEAELLQIYTWLATNAPAAIREDKTVADDAVALMTCQRADIDKLQVDFEVEAGVLRSSITEQDIMVQNLRHEVDRLQALVQQRSQAAVLMTTATGNGKTAPAAPVSVSKRYDMSTEDMTASVTEAIKRMAVDGVAPSYNELERSGMPIGALLKRLKCGYGKLVQDMGFQMASAGRRPSNGKETAVKTEESFRS